EVDLQGLRLVRLRVPGVPALGHGEARHPAQRGPGRRAVHDRPPGEGVREGEVPRREAARGDPAPALRGGDPGRHRQPGHRPRDGEGHGQERHRQVLRRRHHAQAQAAREAEGRQETDETGRPRRGPAGGVPVGPEELSAMNDLQVRPERDTAPPGSAVKTLRKSLFREYSEAIIIAVLLALFIRQFAVQAFTIPSGSMMDTLLIGDYILVNKFLYGAEVPFTDLHLPGIRDPHRGDIIVFKYPNDETRDFIKRIIAVG